MEWMPGPHAVQGILRMVSGRSRCVVGAAHRATERLCDRIKGWLIRETRQSIGAACAI